MRKDLKLAVRWEVKTVGKERSIQLFDADGNKLRGSEARWEGSFYCYNNQLTSLAGSPMEVGGDFYCYNNQLTSLAGSPKEVEGSFDCSFNQLTSLAGAPKEVGRGFDCSFNKLTSLAGAPKEDSKLVYQRIFKAKLKRGYVRADGITLKLISKKGGIYKGRKIGSKDILFVAQDGWNFAHGKTAKEAVQELKFKIGERDVSKYKKWKLSTSASLDDMCIAYRAITGACRPGIEMFVGGLARKKKKYSVEEVIELTKGRWGSEAFSGFFLGSDG